MLRTSHEFFFGFFVSFHCKKIGCSSQGWGASFSPFTLGLRFTRGSFSPTDVGKHSSTDFWKCRFPRLEPAGVSAVGCLLRKSENGFGIADDEKSSGHENEKQFRCILETRREQKHEGTPPNLRRKGAIDRPVRGYRWMVFCGNRVIRETRKKRISFSPAVLKATRHRNALCAGQEGGRTQVYIDVQRSDVGTVACDSDIFAPF